MKKSGSGAGLLDLERLGADVAFTLDGDEFGAVEYETFNAADGATFTGVSVHPGSAKGILKNAVLMAMEFIAALPEAGAAGDHRGTRRGLLLAESVTGGEVERASVHCLIRDHDKERYARRKETLRKIIASINETYGPARRLYRSRTATIT